MSHWLNRLEIITWYAQQGDADRFCPHCMGRLARTHENLCDPTYYCPNDMCLNEDTYDQNGNIIIEEDTL